MEMAEENSIDLVTLNTHDNRELRGFPTWHFSMMNDHVRNQAIIEAISNNDLRGKTVFEIGTGAGLIAMYFARHGTKHVYTCEIDEQLHAVAVRNIRRNNLEDRITVIHASSSDFLRSQPSTFQPDIIFTETLDCGVVGEGYATIAKDIESIARNDTVILPELIEQYGFLVNSEEIAALNAISSHSEFDLTCINKYSTRSYFPIRYQMYAATTMSAVQKLRTYIYREPLKDSSTFTMTAYRSGTCHGIVTYFHAIFGNSVVTNDVRDSGHWHQAFHPFPQPIEVTTGKSYTMVMRNDGSISPIDN